MPVRTPLAPGRHSSTTTTETIYRKQIRLAIIHGADVMDRIFPGQAD